MKFSETQKFSTEFRRLSKRYRSLPEDLEEFKKIVAAMPLGTSKHFVVLRSSPSLKIVKARLFCRDLKQADKLRIVYAYHEAQSLIEFIELYFKGDKEREDKERIETFFTEQNCSVKNN